VVVKVVDILVGTSMLHDKPHRGNSLHIARQSLFPAGASHTNI
jgi:hypothetical protein